MQGMDVELDREYMKLLNHKTEGHRGEVVPVDGADSTTIQDLVMGRERGGT